MSAKALSASPERSAPGRVVLSDLPGVLREIAEVAGVEAALRIAALRGGARMKIPVHVEPGHWLALAIGEEKARDVAAHFTSGHTSQEIEVPHGPAGLRARVVSAVRQLLSDGVSAEEIARRMGVSSRMVRRHRKAMRIEAAAVAGSVPPQINSPKKGV